MQVLFNIILIFTIRLVNYMVNRYILLIRMDYNLLKTLAPEEGFEPPT